MTTAVLATPPFLAFYDADGNPLSGGLIYTYAAGTDTPKATFTTQAASVEKSNPIVLDDAGRATWWIVGAYKYVVKDSLGNTIATTDNVTSFNTLAESEDAFFQSFSGTNSQTAFTLSADQGTDSKGLMIFLNRALQSCVTNGTFATDTDWTKGSGWTIGSGVATATGAISTAISQTSPVTLVEGQAYAVTYVVTRSAGGLIPSIGGTSGVERTASGTYKEIIIAGSSQTIAFTGNAFTGTLDTVTVTVAATAGFDILNPSAYTVNGTALTFASAPATGTNNIFVFAPSSLLGAASSAAALAQTYATAALASQVAAAASATSASTSASTATTQATNASTSATNAATSASAASTSATNAATSASAASTSATNAASTFTGTSTSSNSIGTGAKTFTTQANKNFVANIPITVADSTNAANYMTGTVTSYSGTTLIINSTATGGSGTIASWNISVSGVKGVDGAGTGDVTGQASSVDSEIALFSSTTGKVIKRATGTGYTKVSSGVLQTPVATVPLIDLANQAASTFLMNATSGSAPPTAVALSASQLAGRGATGDGGAITLGTNLSMSGTTLNGASSSGRILQIVETLDSTYATTTTIIPYDDTIPQNTEGVENTNLATAFTPQSASSTLLIDVGAYLGAPTASGGGNNDIGVLALFVDSTANALAAAAGGVPAVTTGSFTTAQFVSIQYKVASGSTSARTYKTRYGGINGGTISINGTAARRFGGVMNSYIRVTEVL